MQFTAGLSRGWLGVIAASMFSLSAIAGPAEDFVSARDAIGRGDINQGLPLLVTLATGGLPEAQRLLGELAYQGKGVPRDFAAAFAWSDLAAKAGDPVAQYNLGRMHERGDGVAQSVERALYWYEKSGAQRYGPAQVRAGELAMASDRSKAAYWFNQAALGGDAAAARRARDATAALANEKAENESAQERLAVTERRRMAENIARKEAKDAELRKWTERNPGQPVGANLPPVPNFTVVVPGSRGGTAPYVSGSGNDSAASDTSSSSERPEGGSSASSTASSSTGSGGHSGAGRAGGGGGSLSSSSSTAGSNKSSGGSSVPGNSKKGSQAETGSISGASRSAGEFQLKLTHVEGPDPAIARREEEERQRQIAKEEKEAAERKAALDAYWKKRKEDSEVEQKKDAESRKAWFECHNHGRCGDSGPSKPSAGKSM